MFRRILAATMAVLLLLPLMAAPVAAVSHGCQPIWESTTKQFYGNTSASTDSTKLVTGAKSTIDVNNSTMKLCSNLLGDDMVTAWVSLQDIGSNPNQILQIGIIKCNFSGITACHADEYHYFWARGGCNGHTPVPQDIGVANGSPHTYEIRHVPGAYNLYIDGNVQRGISDTSEYINCWVGTPGDVEAGWFVETNDDGDGSADIGDKLDFVNSYFRTSDLNQGSWFIPNFWSTTSCTFTEDTQYLDGKCDNSNTPGTFYVWSELL